MNTRNTISATDSDVREIAKRYVASLTTGENVRETYLRVLATRTIQELGAEPRSNSNARAPNLSPEEQDAQLTALAAVHEKLAAIVAEVVDDSLGDIPPKERAQVKNRRMNFTRTALYALRLYIRAGKDLTALAPARITKSALAVKERPRRHRPPTPKVLKRRVERSSRNFMAAVLELSESDPQAAVAELDALIGQMAQQLASLGVAPVKDARRAAKDHVPLRVGGQLFVPATATTILRQRARPS